MMTPEGGESLSRTASEFFRVGIANDPKPEDKVYDRDVDAVAKAMLMADVYGFNTPVAVWDSRGDPAWLFMLGEQFKRV